jgi:serine/threonine protein kinase
MTSLTSQCPILMTANTSSRLYHLTDVHESRQRRHRREELESGLRLNKAIVYLYLTVHNALFTSKVKPNKENRQQGNVTDQRFEKQTINSTLGCRLIHLETIPFTYICTKRTRRLRVFSSHTDFETPITSASEKMAHEKNFAQQKPAAKNQNSTASPARPAGPKPQKTPLRKDGPPRQAPFNPWIPRDDYQDIRALQSGAEAITSLTKSTKTGRVYVVKRFAEYPEFSNSSFQEGQPLPNEAKLLLVSLRSHPNILRAFGCDILGCHKGGYKANLYSEYCAGGDLIDHVRTVASSKHTAPESLALHVFISLAQALAYLHRGLHWDPKANRYWQEPGAITYVHGDIKPANVFVRWSDEAKRTGLPEVVLGDLGCTQPENAFKGLTGTEGYMAPEVAHVCSLSKTNPVEYRVKRRAVGHMKTATDVFSLGQTIHLVSTSRHHAVGMDPETEPAVRTGKGMVGVSLGTEPPYVTQALIKAVKACLQLDPKKRPVVREGQGSLLADVAVCREALKKMLANKKTAGRPRVESN